MTAHTPSGTATAAGRDYGRVAYYHSFDDIHDEEWDDTTESIRNEWRGAAAAVIRAYEYDHPADPGARRERVAAAVKLIEHVRNELAGRVQTVVSVRGVMVRDLNVALDALATPDASAGMETEGSAG